MIHPSSWKAIRVQRCTSSRITESLGVEKVLLPEASCQPSNADWRDDFWSFDEGNDDDEDLEDLGRALSEAASLASDTKRESLPHQYEAMIDSSSTDQTIKIASRDTTGTYCSSWESTKPYYVLVCTSTWQFCGSLL